MITRYRRLIVAFALVVGVNFLLAAGYWAMNVDRHNPDGSTITFLQCLYMTVISTFTVGYGEVVPVDTPVDRIYTMLVIVLGLGTMGYGLSQMTAFIVGGDLQEILGRRKMEKHLATLRDHFLVCGIHDVGVYIIDELVVTKRPFVAIDADESSLRKLAETASFPYLVGDATDEAVLEQARVRQAAGVLCTLSRDSDNLVLAMTCRQLNPKLRIVAKAHDVKLSQRIKQAGADAVVSPQFIGGLRLVSELVRPTVVTFLDQMLREREAGMRVEEVLVEAGSALAGMRLSELRRTAPGVAVMALQSPGNTDFMYVPDPGSMLTGGSRLIVLGDTLHVADLRARGIAPVHSK